MQQTQIVVTRTGRLICKRPGLSTAENRAAKAENEQSLKVEVNELKKKVEALNERVEKLEKANIELVDLTNDDSFETTISVNSDDLIELPNGI